jgi:ABC-type Na+ efflux pump permease subunit
MRWGLIGTVVRLRLRRVAADRANLVWLLVMPLVFSFIMGQFMGDWSAGGRSKPTLIVYGAAHGGATLPRLLEPLRDHADFRLVTRDTTATVARARRLLEERRVSGALIVPAGFADSLAAGRRPGLQFFHDSGRTSSQRVHRAVTGAFAATAVAATARTLVAPDRAADDPARAVAFDAALYDSLLADPRVRLASEPLGRARGEELALTRATQHSGPSYTLMFILMFLLLSAKDLVLERQQRTLDRLRVTRASTGDLILGFYLSGLVVGLLQGAALLGFNTWLFGIDYGESPATLVLVMLLFVAFSAAAGLLLGTAARSGGQADGLGIVLGLGLPALGGLWWPLEVTPVFMQDLGRALPTGQAISVMHAMIGRGHGLAENAGLLLALGAWTAVTLALAVWNFRREAT